MPSEKGHRKLGIRRALKSMHIEWILEERVQRGISLLTLPLPGIIIPSDLLKELGHFKIV